MRNFNTILIVLLAILCSCCSAKKNLNNRCIEANNAFFHQDTIKMTLRKIADWQLANFNYSTTKNLHDNGVDSWTNATFYLGLVEWAKTDNNNPVYLRWLDNIGRSTEWTLPSNFIDLPAYQLYHADEFCVAQSYIGMYNIYEDTIMIKSAKERIDWVMNNLPNADMFYKNKQSWTWCDALFMVPQVYASMAQIENNEDYLRFMDQEFKKTYNYLFDEENQLFFRDGSYFDKKENNGEKVFWGRGNGWVAAGLVNLLKILPEDSSYRLFYEKLFVDFVNKLVSLQDESGFWHASLLDPESYPAPETSATALITYAIAYGINSGLLTGTEYCAPLEKSWTALMSIVDDDGKLGWVQPIGADPKKVTADMTATYGVGAFLLAGNEIFQMEN